MIALHLSLDAAGQNAIIKTESLVLNIPSKNIVFGSSSRIVVSMFRSTNNVLSADLYSILVETEIMTVVTQQYLRGNVSALKMYYSDLLNIAIKNGNMTKILRQESLFYKSNSTLNSVVISSNISSFKVFYAATPVPTASPTISLVTFPASSSPSIALVSGIAVATFVVVVTIVLIVLKRASLLQYAAQIKIHISLPRWKLYTLRKVGIVIHPIDYEVGDEEAKVDVDGEEISLQFQDPQQCEDRDDFDSSVQIDLFSESREATAT